MVFLISCPSFCPMCLDPAMLFLTNFSTVTDHTAASGAQPLPGACLYTHTYIHAHVHIQHMYTFAHANSHMHRHRSTGILPHIHICTYIYLQACFFISFGSLFSYNFLSSSQNGKLYPLPNPFISMLLSPYSSQCFKWHHQMPLA